METAHIHITDDFDARKIYEGMVFYSRGGHNQDKIEVLDYKADNVNHQWREDTYRFKDTNAEVKLTCYSFPNEIPKEGLPSHTLEIEILGEDQTRKKTLERIEAITGIRIRKISES